jgi:hypothetical protein
MTTDQKEQYQYAMVRTLKWLNNLDGSRINAKVIAHYSALPDSMVEPCFNWLEKHRILQYVDCFGGRTYYKTDKKAVEAMVNNLKEEIHEQSYEYSS